MGASPLLSSSLSIRRRGDSVTSRADGRQVQSGLPRTGDLRAGFPPRLRRARLRLQQPIPVALPAAATGCPLRRPPQQPPPRCRRRLRQGPRRSHLPDRRAGADPDGPQPQLPAHRLHPPRPLPAARPPGQRPRGLGPAGRELRLDRPHPHPPLPPRLHPRQAPRLRRRPQGPWPPAAPSSARPSSAPPPTTTASAAPRSN